MDININHLLQLVLSDYSQNIIVVFISCLSYYTYAVSNPLASVTARAYNASHFYFDFTIGENFYVSSFEISCSISCF
jgi:hypothetical protein